MSAVHFMMDISEHCPDCGSLLVTIPGGALCPYCGLECDDPQERLSVSVRACEQGGRYGEGVRFMLMDDGHTVSIDEAA